MDARYLVKLCRGTEDGRNHGTVVCSVPTSQSDQVRLTRPRKSKTLCVCMYVDIGW